MRELSFLIVLFILSSCPNKLEQNHSEKEQIANVIIEILSLVKDKKITELNTKYIHPKVGFFEVHRIGLSDKIRKWNKIEVSTSALGTVYQIITNVKNDDVFKRPIEYYTKYDCENFEWDKEGLFFSYEIIYPKVSNISKNNRQIIDNNVIKLIDNNSIRVVLTKKNLVFYLTKIKKRFYITVIDRVTTDCSA